ELVDAIRRDPSNDTMKVVLMTSLAQRGHAAHSAHKGVTASVTKPIRQAKLYECLRTAVSPSAQASPGSPQKRFEAVPARSPADAKDFPVPRVLLAEDNPTNQIAAMRMLEMLGCQVDVAVNGLEAVRACRDVEYAIVLMDNQMPVMDGFTAARE